MTLAEFTAPEELAIFAPEVSHALSSSLERAGFDMAAAAPGSTSTLMGKIEPLGPERVRLVVQAEGRAVAVEGELERIDELVTALAEKLKEVLPASLRRTGTPVVPQEGGRPVRATPPPPVERLEHGAATQANAQNGHGASAGRPVTKKEAAGSGLAGTVGSPASRLGTGTPASGASSGGERREGEPRAETSPGHPAIPGGEPNGEETHPNDVDRRQPADPPPTDRAPALAQAPLLRRSRSESGVLLHYVGLPTGCQASLWATIAARTFLEHYLHAQVVPSGACGYQPLSQAVIEGSRAGVRSVLMMWFDQLDLAPSGLGYRASGSLRIMVVQDGRLAYHRQLPVGPRLMAIPDPARASSDLVTMALRAVGYELQRLIDNGHQGTASP